MADITLVVMTRNRVDDLVATLDRLVSLDEAVPVIVVDNGSQDGTGDAVERRFPQVKLFRLPHNAGVEARNVGVRHATTPFVAFNDDDSWWSGPSVVEASRLLRTHPRLGAVAAEILVDGRPDPVSRLMHDSPLPRDDSLPGVPVLGFLACAVAVRRAAFLEVGGFHPRLHFGGEEQLLAADLAADGWAVRYVADLTVNHRPSAQRDSPWRERRNVRNALWFLWLRRPWRRAAPSSWRVLRRAAPVVAIGGLVEAARGLPWVLRERRVVPAPVEEGLRLLDLVGRDDG